jgi:hypothetical protein
VTTADGLLWSVEDDAGDHLVLVIRAVDEADPGTRLPMSRETTQWLIRRLTDAVAATPTGLTRPVR